MDSAPSRAPEGGEVRTVNRRTADIRNEQEEGLGWEAGYPHNSCVLQESWHCMARSWARAGFSLSSFESGTRWLGGCTGGTTRGTAETPGALVWPLRHPSRPQSVPRSLRVPLRSPPGGPSRGASWERSCKRGPPSALPPSVACIAHHPALFLCAPGPVSLEGSGPPNPGSPMSSSNRFPSSSVPGKGVPILEMDEAGRARGLSDLWGQASIHPGLRDPIVPQ